LRETRNITSIKKKPTNKKKRAKKKQKKQKKKHHHAPGAGVPDHPRAGDRRASERRDRAMRRGSALVPLLVLQLILVLLLVLMPMPAIRNRPRERAAERSVRAAGAPRPAPQLCQGPPRPLHRGVTQRARFGEP
jgi:hypothetical protein